ncbi:MAG TPA: DNA starvation/stationary phase protection protein [Myxococcales bacterium]|jgi:starvation-inducible DNA-binding protein
MPANKNPRTGKGNSQTFGTLTRAPIGLADEARRASVKALTQLLVDTITLRDLYKKHHWQVSGPTFYSLHLLYDKHFDEQHKLVDLIGERIQILGGVAPAMAHDVAEATSIERPPKDSESVPAQLARLLAAHEKILVGARRAATESSDLGDYGTNDLLVSAMIPTNEMQVWFIGEHLVPQTLVVQPEQAAEGPTPYESSPEQNA